MKQLSLFLILMLLGLGLAAVEPEAGAFGVGIQVGSSPGLGAKFWTSYDNAIQLSLGSSDANSIALEGSDLWHIYGVFHSDSDTLEEQVPVYAGLGGIIASGNVGPTGADPTLFGIHGVAGVSYLAEGSPLDLYLEIRPTLSLTPQSVFSIKSALGLRYYF